jgi:uncharacterized membrane protein
VTGLPAGFGIGLPGSVLVPAGQTVDVPLQITVPAGAIAGTDVFEVDTSDAAGASDSVEGQLTVTSTVALPGVNLSLSPSSATAGQGTPASYTVTVTNVGNLTDTYNLSVAGLPAGIQASFSQATITVPPGESNFRDVTLTLTPPLGATVGDDPFSVTATSTTDPTTSATADGTLDVVANGVSVGLNPPSGAPGTSFQMTVTNTGTVTDTFDLSLASPAGLVATLGTTKVTLDPGASQIVPISTASVSFALPGNLLLTGIATSEGNPAVKNSDSANLTIGTNEGMTTGFRPSVQVLPLPGTADFLLLVQNTGNVADSYSATITGTSGPVSAHLLGLTGQSTQTIPTFILPALATGAIQVQADLSSPGQGKVTVEVQSLTNPNIQASSTATVIANRFDTPQLSPALRFSYREPSGFSGFVLQGNTAVSPPSDLAVSEVSGITPVNPTIQAQVDVSHTPAIAVGVAARLQPSGLAYVAALTSDGQAEILLFNAVRRSYTVLASAPVPGSPKATTLQFVVQDATLFLFVNGATKPLLTVMNTEIRDSGAVGLFALGGNGFISDFGVQG